MAHVKTSRHSLLLFITFLQRCRNTHLENTYATWQRGTLQLGATRRLLLLIHRNLPSRECATVAPGNKREKEHLMLDVVMLALGLGFFLVAVGYAHACERL